MVNHKVEFVDNQRSLESVINRLTAAEVLALDIETINWWDRQRERISLIQFGFRENGDPAVVIIDALAKVDAEVLRGPLEWSSKIKAIHNASFDAVKLQRFYRIAASPIHDTMIAARRSGEKKCSLKAQAAVNLGFAMDKTEQRSDWSRRPLSEQQLRYAALDAVYTLLLYEHQIARGLRGDYQLRAADPFLQSTLPLTAPLSAYDAPAIAPPAPIPIQAGSLSPTAFALLGVVAELPERYGPEQLAASVGEERIGLAGWIIDRILGFDAELDEAVARNEIAALCEIGLLRNTPLRRLEASEEGAQLWRLNKPPA